MKVIIGSESFPPNLSGVAVAAHALAENLAQEGHQVWVIAPSPDRSQFWEKDKSGFLIFRLRSVRNVFRTDFRVTLWPGRAVSQLVARLKPDLIHLHDPVAICKNLLKAGKKHHIPVIATNHFSLEYLLSYASFLAPLHPLFRTLLSRHLAGLYNQCDYVLCPTETVKRNLEAMGVVAPVEAISNGVAVERFYSYEPPQAIRLKYHLPRNPLVLYVGRIDKDKSLEVLLRAVPRVVEATDAHFVLVGDGTVMNKLKSMVERQKLSKFVSFLGPIEHDSDSLPAIYQASSVLLIPSAVETQSIVTLEAMASGLPVVAAGAGALPELVRDGVNGLLFQPEDAEEAAKQTVRILQDPPLARQMREASLKTVAAHRIEESFRRIKKVYEEVTRK